MAAMHDGAAYLNDAIEEPVSEFCDDTGGSHSRTIAVSNERQHSPHGCPRGGSIRLAAS
jgi:hypothetical protein